MRLAERLVSRKVAKAQRKRKEEMRFTTKHTKGTKKKTEKNEG